MQLSTVEVLARQRRNYDTDRVSLETGLGESKDGKTQQHFADECDINTIVRKFNLTGQLPENVRLPQYIDYEGVFDFQTAMQSVMQAEEAFMTIPAHIRAQFQNDPQVFHDFVMDGNNKPALRELGLLKPEPPPEPIAPSPAPAGTSSST